MKQKFTSAFFSLVFTFSLSCSLGHLDSLFFFVLSSFFVLPLCGGGGDFFLKCWSFRQGYHPYWFHIDMQRQLSTPLTFFFFFCRVTSFIILMSRKGFAQRKKQQPPQTRINKQASGFECPASISHFWWSQSGYHSGHRGSNLDQHSPIVIINSHHQHYTVSWFYTSTQGPTLFQITHRHHRHSAMQFTWCWPYRQGAHEFCLQGWFRCCSWGEWKQQRMAFHSCPWLKWERAERWNHHNKYTIQVFFLLGFCLQTGITTHTHTHTHTHFWNPSQDKVLEAYMHTLWKYIHFAQ